MNNLNPELKQCGLKLTRIEFMGEGTDRWPKRYETFF